MTHTVQIGDFQGPLGLLLQLVERNKMEVTGIAVADITAQYLDHIRKMQNQSPESLSEFLQLGARLLYIKSLALLPQTEHDEQGEELARLEEELQEYRRFQQLGRQLGQLASQPAWERQVTEKLDPSQLPLPNLTLDQLQTAFEQAMRKTPAEPKPAVISSHISIQTAMANLRKRLADTFKLSEVLDTCTNRQEVIVTFLALLELIREGVAHVSQDSQFGAIHIEAING